MSKFGALTILYDDDGEPERIWCENGFVSRVVSAVWHENHPDARRVAQILNADARARERAA